MKKKLAISIVIALALLAIAVSLIDRQKFVDAFESMRTGVLAPVIAVLLLGQLLRALRWWLLVRGVVDAPFRRIAPVCFLGFMAINLFPLRAGELARPLLLRNREKVPFTAGLATVVAERVIDALAIFSLLMISLALVPAREITVAGEVVDLAIAARVLLLLFVPMAVFLAALVVFRERMVALVQGALAPLSTRLAEFGAQAVGAFVAGLAIFRTPARAIPVVGLTVLIWTFQTIAMGIGFSLFGLELPLVAAIPVLAITMAGITIPAGIGMSGNFQVFCMAALVLYAVDPAPSLAYAVVMNVVMFGVAVAMGLAAMPFVQVRLSSVVADPEPDVAASNPHGA